MRRVSAWMAIVLAIVAITSIASALHRHTPAILQITTAPSQVLGGQRSAWQSSVWTFHSDADLLGNGNSTPNIFLFDQSTRVRRRQLGIFQLTFGDQPSEAPAAAVRGRVLAFQSQDDFFNNGSTGRQIFAARRVRWRIGIVPLFQVTKDVGESFGPVVSGNGRYLFFTSTGDLRSEALLPGTHVYRVELRRLQKSGCDAYPCPFSPGLALATPEESANPATESTGNLVVFESRGDAAGTGCVNGALQLFLKDFSTGIIQQLTFGLGDSRNAWMSLNGKQIVFESDADFFGTSSRTNIFMIDRTTTPFTLTQLTFGVDGDSTLPTLPAPGANRVVFLSTANLTGLGTAGTNQVFLLERDGPRITQLTSGADSIQGRPGAVFSFVTFPSTSDLIGNGNSGLQLFLLNSFPILDPIPPTPRPSPTATPIAGEPANVELALLTPEAGCNNNNTLTTVMAATVSDFYGNPVPDGTFVDLDILPPTNGAVISDGSTNTDPTCDVSSFEAGTGVPVLNQAGVAHVCLTYPQAQVGTFRDVTATVATATLVCMGGSDANTACTNNADCLGGECVFGGEIDTTGRVRLPPSDAQCTGCEFNGEPCNDGNLCTEGDVCAGGTNDRACVGGTNAGAPCTTGSECPGGQCLLSNPPTCEPGAEIACTDDLNPCTEDVCNFFTGECGVPTPCADDDNPCTDDVCDPTTGSCGIFNTDPCDDRDLCTIDDVCSGGICGGTLVTCPNDANPCTDDVCNPETGDCGVPIPCVCP